MSEGGAQVGRKLLKQSRYLLLALVLLPLLLSCLAYYSSERHKMRVAETLAAERFVSGLNELLSTVESAETGQRGFLLSDSDSYLTPYLKAKVELPRQLEGVIQQGVAANVPRVRWRPLRALIEAKFKELQLTIDLHTSGSPEAALAELRTNRGQEEMIRIREGIDRLKAEQMASYNRLAEETQSSERAVTVALGCAVFLAPLLLLAALRVNNLYVRQRDEAESQVRKLNEELEERVRERTAQLEERTRLSEEQAAELARSNADLEQFASIASHDLQEPLRMIGSYVGLLARRYSSVLDETAQTYIEYAVDGAKRMQALINDLLVYSRAGTQEIKKEVVALDQVVANALKNLRLALLESGAELECATLPQVRADQVKLCQVMQNLLGNAIKFRKPDVAPKITVGAKRDGTAWLFWVTDNGIGFDPKYSDRIFMVFQRLHGAGRYPGNGIGLSICRRIIEHHGGRLWAESVPGRGSTFYFTLPA